MDYDFRNRASSPYDAHVPMYRTTSSSAAPSSHPMYPRIGLPGQTVVPLAGRNSFHQNSASIPSSSGSGIHVALKPEYRMTPLPQLAPQVREIPRSNFEFDFELERKILVEVEKGSHNFGRLGLENLPSKSTGSTSSPLKVIWAPSTIEIRNTGMALNYFQNANAKYTLKIFKAVIANPGNVVEKSPLQLRGATVDLIMSKCIGSGLNREAVGLAVVNYGDNPKKVEEFTKGYSLLKEMGFSSDRIAEALFMFDNDTDKALAHCLN